MALASRFEFTELAYDRTFAGEIVRNLQDEGLSLVEFGQGFLCMGPAAAEFMRLLTIVAAVMAVGRMQAGGEGTRSV